MASFGRLVAAAASGTIDTTFALASLNFDFSLYRVEAPKEYAEIGSSLSTARRVEAESGRAHVTARKLGALFEPRLPSTPELVKIYGLRVTETLKSPNFSVDSGDHGIFARQAGIDATSIWAAATSGHAAIKIHLLACMLARLWTATEATSIWEEVVQARKRQIRSDFEELNSAYIATTLAAQQEITRQQLSEWDASARSWLRAADTVNVVKQTQFNIIANSVHLAVNSKPSLYESVMDSWTIAMESMERLIQGMPQRMNTGEVLLGLSAWHLYPDLVIAGPKNPIVKQNDNLIHHGGVLTIGLQASESLDEGGLYWSLPLAHLRYYGDVVPTHRSLERDGTRLTRDQFLQTVIGCIVGGWGEKDTLGAIAWIAKFSDIVRDTISQDDASQLGHTKDLLSISFQNT